MGGKGPVPIFRPTLVAPVLDELDRAGALQGLLRRTKLPADLRDRPDDFAPAHAMLHFMAEAADDLESPDLAFCAATHAHREQLGHWGPSVERCYTLRSALRRFCVLYPQGSSFLRMGLVEAKAHAWLWRHRSLAPKDPPGEVQGEQFTMGSMIQAVRMAAGSQWNPPAVAIESAKSEWALCTAGLEQSRVDFGSPFLAIAIPHDLLDLRLPRPSSGGTVTNGASPPAASSLAGSLIQALLPLATQLPLSLELGAEIAETTPRTLQRWLAHEGTGWRQVVDRVRFEAYERLILDPALTLTEVSTRLGYADHAHFTRAFGRWTGEAPSANRARGMREGDSVARGSRRPPKHRSSSRQSTPPLRAYLTEVPL